MTRREAKRHAHLEAFCILDGFLQSWDCEFECDEKDREIVHKEVSAIAQYHYSRSSMAYAQRNKHRTVKGK